MRSMPDVVVLCGGAGLRLKEITGTSPKALANVAGRPFLGLLFRQLRRSGFERVILAVGYQHELIRSQFGERAFGLHLVYSCESSPLGTGGALGLAAERVESEDALVMNGDSYTDADLDDFVHDHDGSGAEVSMVVAPSDGRTDVGSVQVSPSGRMTAFCEKDDSLVAHYLNAGIYLISKRLLNEIPAGLVLSLEHDLFPSWLEGGKLIQAFVSSSGCVDIGTPDRYRGAQDALANAELLDRTPRRD
jgi:NDP-sugar pyrophosphorylase family protein